MVIFRSVLKVQELIAFINTSRHQASNRQSDIELFESRVIENPILVDNNGDSSNANNSGWSSQ